MLIQPTKQLKIRGGGSWIATETICLQTAFERKLVVHIISKQHLRTGKFFSLSLSEQQCGEMGCYHGGSLHTPPTSSLDLVQPTSSSLILPYRCGRHGNQALTSSLSSQAVAIH